MFRIVICDDNMTDLEILRNGTEQWIKNTAGISGTVSTFRNSKELQEYIMESKSRFDLYLLDVMMSQPDGILLGRLIRQYDTEVSVIYVTSSSEYALEAYGIHAIRYLMKPLNMEELHSALNLLLDGELRETQATDYFAAQRSCDCAVRELTAR